MYIPILSSFSTRSGERAFASGDERKKGERVRKTGRKGEGTGGASASRCASPLFATDSTTHTDRSTASLITQTHHLYGVARQISKLRRRASSGGLSLGAGNRLFMRAYARPDDRPITSLHINHTRSSTYKQTGRKEGRKSGYHESSSKRARLPPSTVHFLPERHTESSTYRRISGREEG